jgi:hypothetical protein
MAIELSIGFRLAKGGEAMDCNSCQACQNIVGM